MLCVTSWTPNLRSEGLDLKFKYELNRVQSEKVLSCFEERDACEKTMNEIEAPKQDRTLTYCVIAFVMGVITAKVIK